MIKNPPSNAGYTGSIPGLETKIPHAVGQLSPHAPTIELTHLNESPCTTTTEPTHPEACTPQLEKRRGTKNPHAATREKPTHHNEEPKHHSERSRMPQPKRNAARNK